MFIGVIFANGDLLLGVALALTPICGGDGGGPLGGENTCSIGLGGLSFGIAAGGGGGNITGQYGQCGGAAGGCSPGGGDIVFTLAPPAPGPPGALPLLMMFSCLFTISLGFVVGPIVGTVTGMGTVNGGVTRGRAGGCASGPFAIAVPVEYFGGGGGGLAAAAAPPGHFG